MVGQSSGASYGIATIGVTQEYFAKDGLEDNTEIDFEASTFLDFTENDPFSEGTSNVFNIFTMKRFEKL